MVVSYNTYYVTSQNKKLVPAPLDTKGAGIIFTCVIKLVPFVSRGAGTNRER